MDGGKTFFRYMYDPEGSVLDPVKDKDILDRLQVKVVYNNLYVRDYHRYYIMEGGQKKFYYTFDGGQTFVGNSQNPYQVDIEASNPAHAAQLAQLRPDGRTTFQSMKYVIYQDPNDTSKRYYSSNGGQTFCEDYNDEAGTTLDRNDPGYAALAGRLVRTDETRILGTYFTLYRPPNSQREYWSADNGKTFYTRTGSGSSSSMQFALDSANPADAAIIASLSIVPEVGPNINYLSYQDPVDGKIYYTPMAAPGQYFVDSLDNGPYPIALDASDPAQKVVIDRLQPVQSTSPYNVGRDFPDIYYVWEDGAGKKYYSYNDGQSFTSNPTNPYNERYALDPSDPADKAILDSLKPVTRRLDGEYYEWVSGSVVVGGGLTISTQQAAQMALVAIDRAIVSKDKIRAHLGALQNRLENTVANLNIQAENMQSAESRISDTDVAQEMTLFVRNQILTQSAVAMLGQANSFPHMMARLLNA